jgi:uncharacterized protein YbjT (DUF2867 family)
MRTEFEPSSARQTDRKVSPKRGEAGAESILPQEPTAILRALSARSSSLPPPLPPSPTFDGDAYNLTGPAALSYAEAARILSDVIGRPVTYTPVDDACFIDLLTNAGVPEDYAEFLATIYYPVRQGWTEVVTGDVERVTGRVPYPFQTYARDHAADFVV